MSYREQIRRMRRQFHKDITVGWKCGFPAWNNANLPPPESCLLSTPQGMYLLEVLTGFC